MKLTQVTHYHVEDVECDGDYCEIELLYSRKVIATWGDYYHDKGEEKLEGFIQGVEWALGEKVELTRENVADWDYFRGYQEMYKKMHK